jgi:hypothetical protein
MLLILENVCKEDPHPLRTVIRDRVTKGRRCGADFTHVSFCLRYKVSEYWPRILFISKESSWKSKKRCSSSHWLTGLHAWLACHIRSLNRLLCFPNETFGANFTNHYRIVKHRFLSNIILWSVLWDKYASNLIAHLRNNLSKVLGLLLMSRKCRNSPRTNKTITQVQ